MALKFQGNNVALINSLPLAQKELEAAEAKKADKEPPKRDDTDKPQKENDQLPLEFAGVDAQYFAAVMLPQHVGPFSPWFADIRSVIVGNVPPEAALRKKVDSTCRLTSIVTKLEPQESLKHDYQVFVGPKLPALLEQYTCSADKKDDLGGLVYYGWFWLGRQADGRSCCGSFHVDRPQLRAGDHHADRARPAVHVPALAQAGAGDEEDAGTPAGDEEDQREIQGQRPGADPRHAGTLAKAQLQPARRLLAGLRAVADFHGACIAR